MKQKQLRWLGLILILAGAVSLGLAACEKKESEISSDSGHIVLDDYEIQYKGFTVMPGKTIQVQSAYHLPDGDKKTLEAEFSQLLGKKKGILTIDLEDTLP